MPQEKVLIFDSSTLISFAMNSLYDELRELKRIFNGKFIIPHEVKEEIIDKPLNIKRFELEALKLKELMDSGVLELPSVVGVGDREITDMTTKMLNIANKSFRGRFHKSEDYVHLIDSGEAACLALASILKDKKCKCYLAIDERTTRMLVEKPENLKKLLENKLHTKITYISGDFRIFKGFKIVRSAELIYVAYKKKLVKLKNGNAKVLDAMLWAVKFKGCSISDEEIAEIERLG